MKITNSDLILLRRGIAVIDAGYQAIVGDKTIPKAFKLGGPVRLALARCGAALKADLDAFDKANKALFEETDPEEVANKDGEPVRRVPLSKLKNYQAESEKLLHAEIDVKLGKFKIKMTELKLDENAIPAQALIDLAPILIDDEAPREGATEE